jgi:hypothetical protein
MEKGLPFERLHLDDGWFAGYLGPVQCVYYGVRISPAAFARYLDYLGGEIDSRTGTRQAGVLYEIPAPTTMAATQRRAIANVLAARREKLRATVAAYSLVTGSLFVRSIMQTIFFFAPPPYPHSTEADPFAGLAFLAKHLPAVEPVAWCRLYTTGRSLALERIGEAQQA